MQQRLAGRRPELAPGRLVADLVPPPRFAAARFSTYDPAAGQPTQAAARAAAEAFATTPPARTNWLRRRTATGPAGLYLDGGFGVGKTHLLASIWHAATGPKAYGTFVEITHLAGALGFTGVVDALSGHRLLCVDEFELDDPGDTVLVSSLLGRLADAGVRIAATSNTLPGRLGEGRFAAQDFLREIQGLAARFTAIRVDGPDYRHRDHAGAPDPLTGAEVTRTGPGATLDDWDALVAHLATLHPSRYGALLDGVSAVHLRGVAPVPDQSAALRIVVLADRLYDRDIPVRASGVPMEALFAPDMLAGGYRKKYLRAISRLSALARVTP
ncbi:MAG: cell division protein ZapE [Cryptosporangiaceae bacterium]|nr:cell division protein ZapE [Cryptosporangiaceae bacterium]